ncbi:MAG TPA: signal peptidase I [Bdellovibrionota bacterium]|nr:signal peptidase I [Bdellovibrionota bacterium]
MDATAQSRLPTQDLPPAKSRRQWLVENVLSLGLALLVVFMIRSSIVEAFKIPSGSMIPTLFIGDHIFVNKLAYGVKIPFSDADFAGGRPTYIMKREPPKRGDIIVFNFPRDPSIYFIKRVIGTPGDTIEVRNKVVYINNKAIPRTPAAAEKSKEVFTSLDDQKFGPNSMDLLTEHLDGIDHPILLDKSNFTTENYGPITVPPDHLFVMGDNRDFSNDSRFWGMVPMYYVKGKAMFIWLSIWLNFSDNEYHFRRERIGTVLH